MSIWSSVISAGGSLLGSLVNAGSQSSTNAANMQIAQMNNEFNERMLQKQMDYNTEMWNKQNEYNTASAQRQRLEEAGLNPYMMMSGGSAGTATSANGVNPPTAQQVQMQAPQIDLSTPAGFIQQAIELNSVQGVRDAQARKTNEEADQVHIENQYQAMRIIAEIGNIIADTGNKDAQRKYQEMLNGFAPALFSSDVKKKDAEIRNLDAATTLANANTISTMVQAEFTRRQMQWVDARAQAEIANVLANTELTREQKKKTVSDRLLTDAQTKGVKLNNNVLERTVDTLVDRAYEQTEEQTQRARGERYSTERKKAERHGTSPISVGTSLGNYLLDLFGYGY